MRTTAVARALSFATCNSLPAQSHLGTIADRDHRQSIGGEPILIICCRHQVRSKRCNFAPRTLKDSLIPARPGCADFL